MSVFASTFAFSDEVISMIQLSARYSSQFKIRLDQPLSIFNYVLHDILIKFISALRNRNISCSSHVHSIAGYALFETILSVYMEAFVCLIIDKAPYCIYALAYLTMF